MALKESFRLERLGGGPMGAEAATRETGDQTVGRQCKLTTHNFLRQS